jgi:hypothetical protein
MNDHNSNVAWLKVFCAWIGVLVGGVTLSQVAICMTIVFTGLQIYRQVRDIRKENRMEMLEVRLKTTPDDPTRPAGLAP